MVLRNVDGVGQGQGRGHAKKCGRERSPDRGWIPGGRGNPTGPDTKPCSAPGTASHDAVPRHNSPLSIESAELRPHIGHDPPFIAMNPEPRPYSRRTSRLSIESGEL